MIRLALPVYVELLTAVVAVGLIDLLWVSSLGEAAIAAVTIGTTVEHVAYGLFLAVPTGVTVLVARRHGRAPLAPVIRTGRLLWAALSVVLVVPGVLLREPLAALVTDERWPRCLREWPRWRSRWPPSYGCAPPAAAW